MSKCLFITLLCVFTQLGNVLFSQSTENVVDSLLIESDTLSTAIDTLAIPVSNDGLDQEVNYSADDSIIYDIANEQVYLYGNASVSTQQVTLEAGQIIFNFGDKSVDAEPILDSLGNLVGVPMFKEGAQEFSSDKIAYNFDTKKGKISQLVTRQGDGFLVGGEVKKNEKDELFASDAYYTTCDHEHPHFQIKANKIKVIPDKVIVTGPANLVINQGYYFRGGGFYLGINDYMDLGILGDIYTRGTWKLNMNSNYALRYRFRGRLSVEYGKLRRGDPLSDGFQSSKAFKIRWNHSQDSKAHPNRTFSASVNAGSSRFDQTFLTNSNNLLTNTFGSNITYAKTFARAPLRMSLSASHSQNTSTRRISVTLPDVSFGLTKKLYPFKRKQQVGSKKWYESITLGYSSKFRNRAESADSTFFRAVDELGVGRFSKHTFDELEYGATHSVPINFNTKIAKYLTFSSGINLTQRWYNHSTELEWDPTIETETTIDDEGVAIIDTLSFGRLIETRKTGFKAPTNFSFNAGLNTRIFGMFDFGEGRKIKAIRHVMNPSVSFSYRPDFANFWGNYYRQVQDEIGQTEDDYLTYTIFSDNIYGGPPIGESQSISFGIDNNFEMKVRAKEGARAGGNRGESGGSNDNDEEYRKVKLLESLRLTMFHNFAVDEFRWSRLNVTARNTFFKKFSMNFRSTFDPYALDEQTGRRINQFARSKEQGLMRLENMNFSLNGRLDSRSLAQKDEDSTDEGTERERADLFQNPDDYVDYDIPWGFNFGYNLQFQKRYFVEGDVETGLALRDSLQIVQTLNFGGDISITPNWKVNITSGWDFVQNELAFTRVNIFRNLHCWDMQFTWVPIGRFQMYEFQISVNSALLQDLKLQRRRQWFDN